MLLKQGKSPRCSRQSKFCTIDRSDFTRSFCALLPCCITMANKTRELTDEQRKAIIQHLLDGSRLMGGVRKLLPRAQVNAANDFDVNQSTVSRLWSRCLASAAEGKGYKASPRCKAKSGRPRKHNPDDLVEAVAETPRNKRRSIRWIAAASGIPKSAAHCLWRKDKLLWLTPMQLNLP